MEKTELLKVTPKSGHIGVYHIARSFENFNLVSLRSDLSSMTAMLGGDRFTEVYFRTKSGNIYKIFQEKNEFSQSGKWVLINKNNPGVKYYPNDGEMYYANLRINEKFYYGNGGYTSEVSEIVCVNSERIYPNISYAKDAVIVKNFEEKP